jgi:putative IMPACT (imprinted ancient) family translation regulator
MVAEKASDDGEPQKTAGFPILEMLKKNDLTDCLGIVVRYFGGILLGAGGLSRAYAKTMRSCIEKADFSFPKSFDECVLEINYSLSGPVEPLLRSLAEVTDHQFTDKATFHFTCETEKTKRIAEEIKKRTASDVAVKIVRSVIKYQ